MLKTFPCQVEQCIIHGHWDTIFADAPPRYKVKDVTGGKIAGTFNRHAVRRPGESFGIPPRGMFRWHVGLSDAWVESRQDVKATLSISYYHWDGTDIPNGNMI